MNNYIHLGKSPSQKLLIPSTTVPRKILRLLVCLSQNRRFKPQPVMGVFVSKLKRWQTAAEVTAHRKAEAKYQKSPEQVRKRENRNLARNTLEREGKAHKGDGRDIGHKNGNALENSPSNWMVENRHKNRSYKRTKGAHKADPRS